MNIYQLFRKKREESIESLEFFYVLQDLFKYLTQKYENNNNSLIIDFIKTINDLTSWEFRKTRGYSQALTDSVFWESREFYRQTMIEFLAGKLNGLEFTTIFWDRLSVEKAKSENLEKNFKKQNSIELNSKSFQFSKIILAFDLLLYSYQSEIEDLNTEDEVSDNDNLRIREDYIREHVKLALEEINKYFMD